MEVPPFVIDGWVSRDTDSSADCSGGLSPTTPWFASSVEVVDVAFDEGRIRDVVHGHRPGRALGFGRPSPIDP